MSPHDDLARAMFDLVPDDDPQEGDYFEPEVTLAEVLWSGCLFHTSFDPRQRGWSCGRTRQRATLTDADRGFLRYVAGLIVHRALTLARGQDT